MEFTLSEELSLLKSSVDGFLHKHYSLEKRKHSSQSEIGYCQDIWHSLTQEMGLSAMHVPEALGGLAMNAIATQVVMESLGEALVLEPFLESVVISGQILLAVDSSFAQTLVSALAEGNLLPALAWAEPQSRNPLTPLKSFAPLATSAVLTNNVWQLNGHKAMVIAGPWANGFIVSTSLSGPAPDMALFWVDANAPGVTVLDYPTVDGRRAADVQLKNVTVGPHQLLASGAAAEQILQRAIDCGTAGICAEAVGAMRRLQADTLEYCKQRRQFGQPIGDFQVLQHRLVDMHIALEMASSATTLAAIALAEGHLDAATKVSMAKVRVNQSCRFIGQNAVQLHGGMGLTDELAISHYFKRVTVIEHTLGTNQFHLDRIAQSTRTSTEISA